MRHFSQKWFTLAELLVITSLLTILSTIATLYLFENFADSRDSARIANLDSLTKNLDMYFTSNASYPTPDNAVDITYSWSVVWQQWELWAWIEKLLTSFGGEIPVDPRFKNYFSYSTTNNSKEYQVGTIFEWEWDKTWIDRNLSKAYAAIERAYVAWDYNEILTRTKVWQEYYYIATPSIISSDLSITGAIDVITQKKLVYHDFFNLPASYSGYLDTNGGFDFNVSDPIIFSGSNSDIQSQGSLEDFVTKLQYIYATTPTESFDVYISLLSEEGVSKVKTFLSKYYKIAFSEPFNCQDIFDLGEWIEDGLYEIDPDGIGPLSSKTVYCDMTDSWEWWTRIDGDHLWVSWGDFSWGNDIDTYFNNLYPVNPGENTIVSITSPVSSGYALRQLWGGADTNYEVHFDDFSVVELGDEIRMTAWVTEEADGGWTNSLWLNPSAWYIFHNRIYYDDGTFSSNGAVEVLATQSAGWKTWRKLQVKNRVKKTPQDFSWYIWLDSEDTRDLYIAWVELELFRK